MMSVTTADDDSDALEKLLVALPEREIFAISGATRQGIDPLLEELWRMLQEEGAASESQHGDVPPHVI